MHLARAATQVRDVASADRLLHGADRRLLRREERDPRARPPPVRPRVGAWSSASSVLGRVSTLDERFGALEVAFIPVFDSACRISFFGSGFLVDVRAPGHGTVSAGARSACATSTSWTDFWKHARDAAACPGPRRRTTLKLRTTQRAARKKNSCPLLRLPLVPAQLSHGCRRSSITNRIATRKPTCTPCPLRLRFRVILMASFEVHALVDAAKVSQKIEVSARTARRTESYMGP